MHRHVLIFAAWVGLSGIRAASPAPMAIPDWVRQRPHFSGFIVGIGSAPVGESTTAGPNRALLLALHDIAAQLDVRLSSEASLQRGETATGLDERYAHRVDVRSDLELEGVEIVDAWVGRDTCWVYARLDKEEFQRRRRAAQATMHDRLETLLDEIRHATTARALAAGLSALELTSLSTGTQEDEVVEALRLRLTGLLLVPDAVPSSTLAAGVGEVVTVRLTCDCDISDADSDRSGVPVRWSMARGTGELTPLTWTDDDGRASTRITRLDPMVSEPAITAAIDLDAFHYRPEHAARLDQLPAPTATLLVPRPRLSAQLSMTITPGLEADRLSTVVLTKLGSRGIDVVEAGGGLRVQVLAEHRQQHVVGPILFAIIDVTVTVSDGDGVRLFHSSRSGLKGSGRTGHEAVRSAFDRADGLFDEAATQSRHRFLAIDN